MGVDLRVFRLFFVSLFCGLFFLPAHAAEPQNLQGTACARVAENSTKDRTRKQVLAEARRLALKSSAIYMDYLSVGEDRDLLDKTVEKIVASGLKSEKIINEETDGLSVCVDIVASLTEGRFETVLQRLIFEQEVQVNNPTIDDKKSWSIRVLPVTLHDGTKAPDLTQHFVKIFRSPDSRPLKLVAQDYQGPVDYEVEVGIREVKSQPLIKGFRRVNVVVDMVAKLVKSGLSVSQSVNRYQVVDNNKDEQHEVYVFTTQLLESAALALKNRLVQHVTHYKKPENISGSAARSRGAFGSVYTGADKPVENIVTKPAGIAP